jgi:sec-independent protein translocase protein TatA
MLYYILLLSMPGGGEWILIFLAVLLLFGGKKIPELMKGIGKGIREFNDAKEQVKTNLEEGMKKEEAKKEDVKKIEQEDKK